MAVSVTTAGSDRLDYGDLAALENVSAATWSIWAYEISGGENFGQMFSKYDETNTGWGIQKNSNTMGTIFNCRNAANSYGSSTTARSLNTWHHIVAVYDGSGATNEDKLKAWLDGGALSLSYIGTIPTSIGDDNAAVRIGSVLSSGSEFTFNGYLAEAAFWNAALPNIPASLAKGASPLWFPRNLKFYAPCIRSPWNDRAGGVTPTTGGSPAVAPHPRIIYPRRRWLHAVPAAAPGAGQAFYHHHDIHPIAA